MLLIGWLVVIPPGALADGGRSNLCDQIGQGDVVFGVFEPAIPLDVLVLGGKSASSGGFFSCVLTA